MTLEIYDTEVTVEEVEEQRDKAVDGIISGSKWPNLTFEQGVEAALGWVLGDNDTPPMEDE